MTQFLLATSEGLHLPHGFAAHGTGESESLRSAAEALFPKDRTIVKVSHEGGELDPIVDQARDEILNGLRPESSQLGVLLLHLAACRCDFVLFWGDDYHELPTASSVAEMWQVLEPQICSERGNWDLYVHYSSRVEDAGV